MFVDDTQIEVTCKPDDHSAINNINSDLSRLISYFGTNRLRINVTKCEYMQIRTYQSLVFEMPNLMIHLNNELPKKVSITKYLGMYIDGNLKWDEHINVMII